MTIQQAIKDIIKQSTYTQTTLAEELGYNGQSGIANSLSKDLRFSNIYKMLDTLGYDIYVEKRPDPNKPGRTRVRKLEPGDFKIDEVKTK